MFIYKTHLPSLPAGHACGRGWGLTRLRPPKEHQEGRGWGGARTHRPRPHAESSGGWGWRSSQHPRSRPHVQSVHVFLQGLQAGIYFGHVSRLVVRAVLCESRRGCGGL